MSSSSGSIMFGDYVGPVTRDNVFFYDDFSGLFLKMDGRRYPRADPERLHGLLSWVDPGPVLTKKGVPRKRQPPPHQDETDTYYTAQSMHYGLEPLKSKQGMKKALLALFGNGHDLKAPQRLQKLEEELSKLWYAENEKGRIRLEKEIEEKEKEEQERLAERRRQHEAILADVDEEDVSQIAPRKRKATSDGRVTKKAKAGGSDRKAPIFDVEGKYAINAPYLAEEWPDSASGGLELMLAPSCGTGKHLWGSFDFGIVTGIIRCGAPPKSVRDAVSFEWRGHEQGEGQMEYGSENKGTLTFLGDGKLRGTMEGGFMRQFTFTGVQKPLNCVKQIKKWKEQWRGINDRSCEAAGRSRWGRWDEDGDYKEQPAGSDTTDAEDAGESDEMNSDVAY
ncbi:hypothetical protein F5148DRAFT_1287000 [Russula earlei]|uniref:Uncharacterized protein n=1 Tax=Russula earlei TaxID=71964 RepID=A0ACC0U2V1_9AGAM|nr:hypothetical protein F5148DRAFT_1287000 [Russula earlei]